MGSSVVIRAIRADEGPALRDIRIRSISDTPDAFGSTLAQTLSRSEGYWAERSAMSAAGERTVMYIAEDGERWVGIVGAFLDEARPRESADLISMWVDPAYRSRGVGRRLVERVIAWARDRGLPQLGLWVTETNTGAIHLYERCGFRETGEAQAKPFDPTLIERRMLHDLS